MVKFISIPKTDLEIGSSGHRNNRIIFFRQDDATWPINTADDIRVVLIGNPEAKLRYAMAQGLVSRNTLAELIDPISGSTFQKLRVYLDKVSA